MDDTNDTSRHSHYDDTPKAPDITHSLAVSSSLPSCSATRIGLSVRMYPWHRWCVFVPRLVTCDGLSQ